LLELLGFSVQRTSGYSPTAILLAQILVLIIYVLYDKRFRLTDIGQRWVEGNTTVGIKGSPKYRHPTIRGTLHGLNIEHRLALVPALRVFRSCCQRTHRCASCSSLTERILPDFRRADKCREPHMCRYAVSQHVNWKFGTWKNRLDERQVALDSNESNIHATYFHVKVFPRPASFASAIIQISQANIRVHTYVHFHNYRRRECIYTCIQWCV
jgi:hypothetical protein